ncbi:MAG: monovalent cation/H(+) antiporter subunit G [Balneolales bacterium]|nr:monovalent cation/H(+) antiporter subunit G [Balneolales bacterium]
MSFAQILASIALIAGAFFTLVAAIGVYRLPDILMRMHASTKAGTLGTGFILLAVAIITPDIGVITRAIATILFLIVTAPVAAHLIGRASYTVGTKLWKNTIVDELHDELNKKDK